MCAVSSFLSFPFFLPQPRSKWRRDSPFTAIAPLDSIVNECLTALFGKFSLRYSGIEFTGSAAAGSCDLLAALKSFWIKRLPKYQPVWLEKYVVCLFIFTILFIYFIFIYTFMYWAKFKCLLDQHGYATSFHKSLGTRDGSTYINWLHACYVPTHRSSFCYRISCIDKAK